VTDTELVDGPLPLARRRLDDAVHALADPLPTWVGGSCRWSDAVYVRLRMALRGRTVVNRTAVYTSKPPCRTDVLALLVAIDRTVGSWEPNGKGTVDRLHQLAGRGWRPQDCALLENYCDEIGGWVLAAAEMLDERPIRVYLHQPCPRCGQQFTYRDNAGESVRVRALRASENGCKCSACGSFWGPEQFEWLARLLGCEPLPT
jgi:hypothetical protein